MENETYQEKFRADCGYCDGQGDIKDEAIQCPRLGAGEPPMRVCPICNGKGWFMSGQFELSEGGA